MKAGQSVWAPSVVTISGNVPGAALPELKTTRSLFCFKVTKSDTKILKMVTPSLVEIFKGLIGPIM